MSWICPNCSNSNEDTQVNCFVCGMDRPSAVADSDSCEGKIVFSNFEAFSESIKGLFRHKRSKRKTSESSDEPSESVKSSKSGKTQPAKPEKEPKTLKPKKSKKYFESDFAKPWPEHNIKFDTDVIKSKGFVRSEQMVMNGINGYCFYKEDGVSQFIRVEMVLIQKMAVKV